MVGFGKPTQHRSVEVGALELKERSGRWGPGAIRVGCYEDRFRPHVSRDAQNRYPLGCPGKDIHYWRLADRACRGRRGRVFLPLAQNSRRLGDDGGVRRDRALLGRGRS